MPDKRASWLFDLGPKALWAIPGWLAGLRYAIGSPQFRIAYEKERSGWSAPSKPLAAAKPERQKEELVAFVRWYNRYIWGEVDGRAANGSEPRTVLTVGSLGGKTDRKRK